MSRLCLPLLALLSGCQLFDTLGSENGRLQKTAPHPYQGRSGGSIRLALQSFNGCAIHPTGEPVGKGSAPVSYPDACPRHPTQEATPATPTPAPLPLLRGTRYFLGQLALVEQVNNLHLDPTRPSEVLAWMKAGRFKNLDWSEAAITSDRTVNAERGNGAAYTRELQFGDAAWQRNDDSIKLELLGPDGEPRAEINYARADFLAENALSGHTRLSWTFNNIAAPAFPGEQVVRAAPAMTIATQTLLRIERAISTQPEKTFQVPADLSGDGAIRITWSQLPEEPFHFPVRFLESTGETCFTDEGEPAACTFGLQPGVTFSPPENGLFYVPGERFEVTLAARDGEGHLLHPPATLPSWNAYFRGESNGLLYLNSFVLGAYGELDSVSALAIAGPLQQMRFGYQRGASPYLQTGAFQTPPGGGSSQGLASSAAATRNVAGTTTRAFTVPLDAPPGTYVLELKLHRAYLGERMSKATPFYFQIGQETRTGFPGRVGNCQLCHRGQLALDNVRHGLPVGFVEGCKTCHGREDTNRVRSIEMIHGIHISSPRFPVPKNDCTVCHLTRESVTRPSLSACGSCHPNIHGDAFFAMQIAPPSTTEPNRFSSCANGCHGKTVPTGHWVPEH
jgi:hypothetical protein